MAGEEYSRLYLNFTIMIYFLLFVASFALMCLVSLSKYSMIRILSIPLFLGMAYLMVQVYIHVLLVGLRG
jgi:hypothetical protein